MQLEILYIPFPLFQIEYNWWGSGATLTIKWYYLINNNVKTPKYPDSLSVLGICSGEHMHLFCCSCFFFFNFYSFFYLTLNPFPFAWRVPIFFISAGYYFKECLYTLSRGQLYSQCCIQEYLIHGKSSILNNKWMSEWVNKWRYVRKLHGRILFSGEIRRKEMRESITELW